jgi:hypothetical protein
VGVSGKKKKKKAKEKKKKVAQKWNCGAVTACYVERDTFDRLWACSVDLILGKS